MPRVKGSKNKKEEVKEEIFPRTTIQKICECKHVEEIHYGGANGHCNTQDCTCGCFK